MFRIPSVFIALAIFASSSPKLAADDLLNSNESRWIEMLLAQLPQVSEIQQRTALATTVAILARAGRDTEATHIAMQQANDDTRNSLLISIAASLAQQSAIESALSAVNKISEPISKERALHQVARALASEGELERAETFIQGTSEVYFKDRFIAEICEYLARERRIEEALARSSGITDTYRKGEVTKLIERIRDGTPSPLEQLSAARFSCPSWCVWSDSTQLIGFSKGNASDLNQIQQKLRTFLLSSRWQSHLWNKGDFRNSKHG